MGLNFMKTSNSYNFFCQQMFNDSPTQWQDPPDLRYNINELSAVVIFIAVLFLLYLFIYFGG